LHCLLFLRREGEGGAEEEEEEEEEEENLKEPTRNTLWPSS
jgi:hypothetical protein